MPEDHPTRTKRCGKCEIVKSADHFYARGDNQSYLRSTCKSCDQVGQNERRRRRNVRFRALGDQPEAKAFFWKRNRIQSLAKHGITPAIYENLFQSQAGRCAICGSEDSGLGLGRLMCVDHDHLTGKVRGLLCRWCNIALSAFGDNLEGVLRVVEYLEFPPAERAELARLRDENAALRARLDDGSEVA